MIQQIKTYSAVSYITINNIEIIIKDIFNEE